tara:strand:+ start:906 stop:1070 length:165 start_codon:yes stop_codon:yes gene_type:complete
MHSVINICQFLLIKNKPTALSLIGSFNGDLGCFSILREELWNRILRSFFIFFHD